MDEKARIYIFVMVIIIMVLNRTTFSLLTCGNDFIMVIIKMY
jgi:hypothetical protein